MSIRHFVGLQLEIKQMKRKNTTSIKTNETKKNIAPVDIIEVSKIVDLPNTEPPLYRKDEYFTPAATSAPIVSSLRAQLRKEGVGKSRYD